jgi:alpha-1,3/alpha-1,6-mannosyltransferase
MLLSCIEIGCLPECPKTPPSPPPNWRTHLQVHFMPSFTDAQRSSLLAACVAVIYTPQNEHFGIVPLEAMAAARPVLACDSGGPKESVVDGETGFLQEPQPRAFGDAMARLLVSATLLMLPGWCAAAVAGLVLLQFQHCRC